VIHLHDCLYLSNQFIFQVAKRLKKPVVTTQHVGLVPYRQGYKNLLQQGSYRTIGKAVLQGSEQVVFVSEAVKSWYEQFTVFPRPAVVVPNGADTSTFRPGSPSEASEIRNALGVRAASPMLLFVGRFTEKKGLRLIHQVARATPQWSWVLVGGVIEEDPRSWFLPNVTVLPPRPQSELQKLYSAADLLVLPSVGEGFPLVVAEAMSCGTPAVLCAETARAVSGLSDLVFVAQPEAGALRDTITRALSDPEKLRLLRSRVVEFTHQVLNWRAAANRYCQIFASV
jgi:glycosyltransferase involved in cell wall biosynthesis